MTVKESIESDLYKNQREYTLIIILNISEYEVARYDKANEALKGQFKDSTVYGEDIDNVDKKIIYYI